MPNARTDDERATTPGDARENPREDLAADAASPVPWDVRDDRLTPTAARAVARAVVLHERARAAAQRRRRGFGVRAPSSMPSTGRLRRREARAA
jgi:hypothetical protein